MSRHHGAVVVFPRKVGLALLVPSTISILCPDRGSRCLETRMRAYLVIQRSGRLGIHHHSAQEPQNGLYKPKEVRNILIFPWSRKISHDVVTYRFVPHYSDEYHEWILRSL